MSSCWCLATILIIISTRYIRHKYSINKVIHIFLGLAIFAVTILYGDGPDDVKSKADVYKPGFIGVNEDLNDPVSIE
jgi:hypothetical protein